VLRARITTLLVIILTLRERIITKTSLIYTKERRFAITKDKRYLFTVLKATLNLSTLIS
jgi:hypothetical protein